MNELRDTGLLDSYGRPVHTELLREEQAAATLSGVRNIYSVIDSSIGMTPEKLIAILRQAEFGDPWLYLELAERMEEKDLLYQGVLHTRKMAVSQMEIGMQAASDGAQERDDANYAREILLEGGLDLHSAIFDILDAIGKGFSVTEIIWDTGGQNPRTGAPEWTPRRLAWRDPRWFMFDWISGEEILVRTLATSGAQRNELTSPRGAHPSENGQPTLNPRITDELGREIGIQPATAPLAPFKFITHLAKAKSGLPIRGGLARVAAWSYLFKNYVLKDWVVFAEIYGQPLRVGKYGAGATENDKALLLRAVANIGTDAAAIIPDSMLIEFTQNKSEAASVALYEKLCAYLDKQTTIAVLGQELTTQLPRGAGSRAAAEVHDAVRRDIATDDARRLAATLNRDLVKPLIDLNRGPRRRYPKIYFGFEEKEDLAQLMVSLGPAVDRGLRISEKWIRDKFGAPDPREGEPLLHPAEKPAAPAVDSR